MWVKIGNTGHIKFFNRSSKAIEYYTGKFCPSFSRQHYSVTNGIITKDELLGDSEVYFPDSLVSTIIIQSIEEPFNDTNLKLTQDIVRTEIAHELTDLLSKISEVKENITALGDDLLEVSAATNNLTEIEQLILSENDNFFTKNLKLNQKWEDSETC
jgi:hypothetical protein